MDVIINLEQKTVRKEYIEKKTKTVEAWEIQRTKPPLMKGNFQYKAKGFNSYYSKNCLYRVTLSYQRISEPSPLDAFPDQG